MEKEENYFNFKINEKDEIYINSFDENRKIEVK